MVPIFKVSYTIEMCYHFCNNFDLSIRNLVWNLLGFDFPFSPPGFRTLQTGNLYLEISFLNNFLTLIYGSSTATLARPSPASAHCLESDHISG